MNLIRFGMHQESVMEESVCNDGLWRLTWTRKKLMMRCLTVVGVSGLETSIRVKMNGLGRNFMFIRKDTCKQVWQGGTIQPTTTIFLVYTYIYVIFPN